MTLTPGIVWLASSDAEISRARTLLRSLTKQGVLDELGFLVLLGALSDRLYPAVNTVMTRARYLVFVPAIYRYIEDHRLAKHRAADGVSRDFQFALCRALLETDATARGIIGREIGRKVARPPSSIYWVALSELGIATSRMSEASYLERLSRGTTATVRLKDDDGIVHVDDEEVYWDREFPTARALRDSGEFPKGTSFDLTYYEAKRLRRCYEGLRPDAGTSLLSHLITRGLEQREAQVEFTYPWAIPGLPEDLHRVTQHARRLSLLARGALLQYHALLFEKKGSVDPGTEAAFMAWWNHARKDLAEWDLENFASLLCIARSRRFSDLAFLDEWREAISTKRSARVAYRDPAARECLRRREVDMRGPKARLRSAFHLRTWIEPERYEPNDFHALSFRHATGTQFARDIVDGLRKGQ